MSEEIEIQNNTGSPLLVSACRSKLSGKLFIHIGKAHGNEKVVKPNYYDIVTVKEVIA
jgi:hypothetical protein